MTKEINLKNITIQSAHDALKLGDFSVQELCDAYLAVIAEKNPDINAYLEIFNDIKDGFFASISVNYIFRYFLSEVRFRKLFWKFVKYNFYWDLCIIFSFNIFHI